MDRPIKKRLGVALLGEPHSCHAGGAVHGGGRDLRRRHLCPISGWCDFRMCDMPLNQQAQIDLLCMHVYIQECDNE